MKIRESGMPPEKTWRLFFNSEEILNKMYFDKNIKDTVEFGSGYGTFTIPAASIISGNVYALDVDSEMMKILQTKIDELSISNIKIIQIDFMSNGSGLENDSFDYVMLFNILHAEEPMKLLNEAFRILRKNGKIGIIHWINSPDTPRGPSMKIRPTEKQCIRWLKAANFDIVEEPFSLPPYHYGIIGIKL